MKSSRSVSCSAPLKGDAMAEHCLQALCSWFAKRRKTTESFCHDAGKRPKRRMRVECLEDARPLLAGTVAPRSRVPALYFPPRFRSRVAAWAREASPSLTQCSPAGQVCGPGVPAQELAEAAALLHSVPDAAQESRTAPGTQRRQFLLKSEQNENDSDRERFLTTLWLSAGPSVLGGSPRSSSYGLPTPSFVILETSLWKLHSAMILKPETGLLLSDSILEQRVKSSYTFDYHFLLELFRKLQRWSLAHP